MKESRTTYSYLIEHMQEPSFQKIWDIAFDFVRKLPSDLCDELHESLNRGVDVLDSEPLLQMYIYAFGKMHNAKLQYAFEHLQKNVIKYREIEIVDYGCGQGLATICYHDFLQGHNIKQMVKRITLIEPSTMALSRAELLCSRFYPDAEIIAINKQFDDLTNEDLSISPKIPTIHLLSNILDVDSYDLQHFSRIVKKQSVGDNEYVLVSPMQNTMRIQRLRDFVTTIEKNLYFEQYLDKRQLDSDKDWTCAVLLCSQSNIIEYDCDEVFEEAKTLRSKELDEYIYKEHIYKLQVCAKFGDKRCQNQLGIWYEYGVGTEQNYQLALEWYKKSAEQEYVSAYANLGRLYRTGEGVEKDLEKSLKYYVLGANENDPNCTFELGRCYFNGYGVEKNIAKAFSYFKTAASYDEPLAKYELFICYYKGLGTEKNEKAALKVLKEAVKLKHPRSCYSLGVFYQWGKLVEKNERKAFKLYKESAELGYCSAQVKLGEIYRAGLLGEDESPKRSYRWYYKAAERGNASAQFYIGYYYASGYGVKKDPHQAFKWYSRAAEQNNPSALNNLANCYEYGKGTSVDLTKAVHYFEEAARLGNTTAQKNLAICYKNGTGVNVNPEKAFFWTLEAAKLSDQDAQRNIAFYYLKGYGTNKNDEESLIWYARCYHRNNSISNAEQAFWAFAEKAQEGDAQSLYVAGKCLQYGIAIDKNIVEANSYFEKAADLGHVESMIKLRLKTSLCELCSSKEAKDNFKDSYGVAYSKDKKVLISTGYIKAEEYKIADGTRIICDNAFYYASIQKVIIPSSVLVIGNNPFSEYKNGWGEKYYINNVESISYNFVVSDNALYTRDMKKLISYFGKDSKFVIPQGVEIIGKRAFADKYNLIDILFPESLCRIEDEAFIYCTRLSKIALPESVTTIGTRCFYGCANLTQIQSLGIVSVIKECTFMGCNITMLTLPNSLVQIEDNAFNSNKELQKVKLPDSLREIGCSCFAYCGVSNISLNNNLQKIGDFCFFKCPIDKLQIPPHVKSIGINPFIGTKHIECVDNGRFVSENGVLYDKENGSVIAHFEDAEIALYSPICRVNSYAFYNSNVTDVFMGANVVDVEPWAFYQAEKLERIIWQKSKIKVIPEGCFGKCTNLCKIIIPASVDEVKMGALFDTYELRKIRFEGGNTKANEKIFERIKRSIDIPKAYESPYPFMGSTICESYGRESLDFDSFTKIEIICPSGYSDSFSFAPIYNNDLHNTHESYGYGMDRTFILKEDGEE